MKQKNYIQQIDYLLKKVVRQPSELDNAMCDAYLKRMQEIIQKTDY